MDLEVPRAFGGGLLLLAAAALASPTAAAQSEPARIVEYRLVVSELASGPEGSSTPALGVNGGVPGPVLRFREGDTARIRVENALANETASIHWHGLLLPNAMDGVPYLTTPPIEPGGHYDFEFTLRQAGTYWYHSHTGLQEQRGVYGAIVIEAREDDGVAADRDHVVVLSDWTDESPHEVMRMLMRGSDYYARRKGTLQSVFGALRVGALREYLARERDRMPAMDVSDVAYDAFLVNGVRSQVLEAEAGERVRVRIVNAGASTYFYVSAGEGPLTIVAADGQLVEPVELQRLLIGMAETYDVLVTVPASGGLELRATAQDSSGHATARIGDGVARPVEDPPRPDLYRMDDMLVGAIDAIRPYDPSRPELERPPAPYRRLRALGNTAFAPDLPRREIRLHLSGDMASYRWGFDDKAFYEEQLIGIREGEVVRMVLVNNTMMHHPIHLHGHFFRVVNGDDERSPLKHTVDVPPMGTRVIEFLADEPGDWLMHCHLLYHMEAGMTRVVSYQAHEPDHTIDIDPAMLGMPFVFAEGVVASHLTMGHVAVMLRREMISVEWEASYQDGNDAAEREVDLVWRHWFGPNVTSIVGARETDIRGTENRLFAGVAYRLPYLVESEVTLDTDGDARVELAKRFDLTGRIGLHVGFQYDTEQDGEFHAGLDYVLSKRFAAVLDWHSDHGLGIGLGFTF